MQSLMQTPPHRPAAPAAEVGTTGPTPTVAEVAQQEEEEEQQAVQQEKVQEEAARAQGGRLLSGLRLPPPLRVPVSREEEGEEEQKEQKQGGLDPEGVAVALLAMQAPDEADIVMASAAAGEVLTLGLWAWALGAVVLASYWRTLPPGLGSGDGTGDLVATACQLSGGSQHPQLTLLLTALALRLIPASWGSDARRSNLISAACCTTLATMLLFLCVHKLGGASARRNGFRPLAVAVPAALLFAWCPRAWAHAIKADGVAVDALIFAGALYAALQCASTWNVRARRMWTRVAVGCAGLALCNQPSTAAASLAAVLLMYGPILVCLVWGLTADLPLFHVLVDLGGVFMLSLLPCAVLPLVALLASSADELLAVGLFETGGRSGTTFPWSWPLTVDRLMAFAWDLKTGQGLYGLVPLLAVVGAAAYGGRGVGRFLLPPRYTGEAAKVVAARNRHIREALGHLPGVRGRRIREEVDQREHEARQSSARVGWGILGASILSLFLPPDTDHTVTTHLLGCLLAGLGLDWMLQLLMIATTYGPMWRRGLGYVGACTLCVGLPLLQLLLTQRGVLAGTGMPAAATGIDMWRGYARSLLEPLPRGAALFVTNRMQSSPLRYHHVCEGLRRDVKIVPLSQIAERQCLSPVGPAVASGTGGVTWPGDMSMWRLLDAFMDRAPGGVFLAGCILNDEAAGYHDTFMTVPFGLTMRFVRQDAPAAEQQWYDRNRNAWRLILHQLLPLKSLPTLSSPQHGRPVLMNDAALIARDVWAHIDEAASHLLDDTVAAFDLEAGGEDEKDGFVSAVGGIKPSSIAFAQLAEAAWWLEVVAAHDPGHRPRVDRNRGLAYSFSLRVIAPPMASHTLAKLGSGGHDDIFGDLGRNVTKWYDPWQWSDWRIWAANRLIDTWATYLGRAEAKRDWDYGRIEQLYELANKARSEAGWV